MLDWLCRIFLHSAPAIKFSTEEMQAYEQLALNVTEDGLIEYDLPYAKFRYLTYVSLKGLYVFHGSNHTGIRIFEPRKQTLYNGQWTKAVFAASDPHWPMFYAIFNRSRLKGSFRNGCIRGRRQNYHFYSLNQSTISNDPWTEGMVYFLPRESFTAPGPRGISFDEWLCHEPVAPIAKLKVCQDDCYYRNKIAVHNDGESLIKTWLFYKTRTTPRRTLGGNSDE
ncbi:hypothetical protein ACN9MH_16640 [Paenibacillus silvae]|uniref:hypothetical protein n=1 Tax=Paenibacillus TaxID=44249 RepID=UPI001C110AF7|nr:hypothetical protein [Paenibacillus barcinonensis]MBU5352067.1 hypothetical protein [Paenibacillus barcinonensis]